MEERLERLEILAMEQESTLERLSEVLQDQQAQLIALNRILEQLEEKLSKYAEGEDSEAPDPPPPHY